MAWSIGSHIVTQVTRSNCHPLLCETNILVFCDCNVNTLPLKSYLDKFTNFAFFLEFNWILPKAIKWISFLRYVVSIVFSMCSVIYESNQCFDICSNGFNSIHLMTHIFSPFYTIEYWIQLESIQSSSSESKHIKLLLISGVMQSVMLK